MGILKVKAFEAGPAKSGISIAQGESRGRTFFRLGLTSSAQQDLLGRHLDPEKDALALIVTNEPNLNHLMGIKVVPVGDANALSVSGGPHGSVGLKVAAWRSGGGGKRPAVSLVVVNRQVQGGGISVKLPDWARPDPDLSATARQSK